MTATIACASPIDAGRFGEHRSRPRGTAAFRGRIGSVEHPARSERYHLYGSWSCPASHRLAILRDLTGLDDVVSMSYVDGLRDARGWAFRAGTGPDPVNGFSLLAEAYERTAPTYAGPITVPVLWDRDTDRIASNDAVSIGIDLMTRFGSRGHLYSDRYATEIERYGELTASDVEQVMGRAVYRPESARALVRTFAGLDERLSTRRYLVGDTLTDADVRLWVLLVRYDAGPNAFGAIGPRLDAFPALWRWAQMLYGCDAFSRSTDFGRIAASPSHLPPWQHTVTRRIAV